MIGKCRRWVEGRRVARGCRLEDSGRDPQRKVFCFCWSLEKKKTLNDSLKMQKEYTKYRNYTLPRRSLGLP